MGCFIKNSIQLINRTQMRHNSIKLLVSLTKFLKRWQPHKNIPIERRTTDTKWVFLISISYWDLPIRLKNLHLRRDYAQQRLQIDAWIADNREAKTSRTLTWENGSIQLQWSDRKSTKWQIQSGYLGKSWRGLWKKTTWRYPIMNGSPVDDLNEWPYRSL